MPLCPGDILQTLRDVVSGKGWQGNSKARMCRLYLIGKAKSLFTREWLWRPIAANSQTAVAKWSLIVAACVDRGRAVELVKGVLHRAWGLPVVCHCIFDDCPAGLGACCGNVCKAMGLVFVKDSEGKGLGYTEPTALTNGWNLRLAEPLLSPGCAYPGYLVAIFTGVLKIGLAFTEGWVAQIFSVAAWFQVAVLSGYKRAEAMRAMHKGLHRAYATSPQDLNSTVKAVHSISYILLGRP